MDVHYSGSEIGEFAYTFDVFETSIIHKCLKKCLPSETKLREKLINEIYADPENEGQARYACQIEELRREIKAIEIIIEEFKPKQKNNENRIN